MTAFPLPPRRTYGWRSWRDVARELAIGAGLGVAVIVIQSAGVEELPSLKGTIRNATLGICIVGVARFLETMLSWALEQSRIATIFRALIYIFGGWAGYFLGVAITGPETADFAVNSLHFAYGLVIPAVVAIILGLTFHHNRKRNDRLLQAVARLKEHEFAEKELEIARSVQRRLLPPPEIDTAGFHVSARSEAAHIIGGDFYDVVRIEDGSLAVIVADVSGKGMAASLIMASCKAALSLLAASSRDARAVMRALNARLCEELERREFVAMAYLHCREDGRIELVNAGMPDPLLIGTGGGCRPLICGGERLPLGIRRDPDYEIASVELRNGDRLVLFSDGLPEACVGDEPIGYERIEQLAARTPSTDDLLGSLHAMPGVHIDDDVTAVIISRSPDRPA